MGGSARKRRRKAALLIRRKKHNAAGEMAVELRLHFQCLDGRPQGYIFKWLDTTPTTTPTTPPPTRLTPPTHRSAHASDRLQPERARPGIISESPGLPRLSRWRPP